MFMNRYTTRKWVMVCVVQYTTGHGKCSRAFSNHRFSLLQSSFPLSAARRLPQEHVVEDPSILLV
jgi:hypothetical protein